MGIEEVLSKEAKLRKVKNLSCWVIYRVARDPNINFVIRYKHPAAENCAEILVKDDRYRAVVRNGGKAALSELTEDFSKVKSFLEKYAKNELYITEFEGSNIVKIKVENPMPGHPRNIPAAEQLTIPKKDYDGI